MNVAVSQTQMVADKASITQFFMKIVNLLRNKEGTTGKDALRIISFFVFLRMIEPILDSELQMTDFIDNLNKNVSENDKYSLDTIEKFKIYIKFSSFYNMIQQNQEMNVVEYMDKMWEHV